MKRKLLPVILGSIGITVVNIPSKVDSAPKILTNWEQSEVEWNKTLKETPAPSSFGNTLVDVTGGKNNCQVRQPDRSPENREVVNLLCWGEKNRALPPLAARWVKSNSKLATATFTHRMPLSAGNTLTDNRNLKYDCHLTKYFMNNQKNPVSEWACWSKITYKPI